MFQTIEQCTDFIFTLKASQYKGDPLQSMRIILKALGNPEQQVKYIHIAGSNGKGSTLNMTRSILMEHGVSVGAFVSPHLVYVNERITINFQQISDEQFLHYANQVVRVINEELNGQFPSFFEFITLVAFQHFAKERPDIVLLEVGIGGLYDSTNVIVPELSIITTISLEHTDLLGDTLEQIAQQKAGIIKDGKPIVVGVREDAARAVILQQAQLKNAPAYVLNDTIEAIVHQPACFTYKGRIQIANIELAMQGAHQIDNAALAITAADIFLPNLESEKVKRALKKAQWAGRFEYVTTQIILDGAHNAEGTASLIATLKEVEPTKRYKFIYAALADKHYEQSIALMDELAMEIHFTQLNLPRAAIAQQLYAQSTHLAKFQNANWQELVRQEIKKLADDELLIITGSLYFIAEVRRYFDQEGVFQ